MAAIAHETTFIYALLDPSTGKVRYVGKSDHPDKRLLGHCSLDGFNPWKDRWIAQLKEAGLSPVLKVIEECYRAAWPERERHWINHYREAGLGLTNITEGGDSPPPRRGCRCTDEQRARMSAAQLGHSTSIETRAKQSAAKMGHPVSEETRRTLSAQRLGQKTRPCSQETRDKIAASHIGISAGPHTAEHRAKISAALTGRVVSAETGQAISNAKRGVKGTPHSEATKAKMSASHKAYWAKCRSVAGGA